MTRLTRAELPLTATQLRALEIIRESFATRGMAPTTRELMLGMGYASTNSAMDLFFALEDKGCISRGDTSERRSLSRNWKLAGEAIVPLLSNATVDQITAELARRERLHAHP